jgi:hypothetical protein
MSVATGLNLNPPIFSNPPSLTLTEVAIPSPIVLVESTPTNLTTTTLQAGEKYLIIANIIIDGYADQLITASIDYAGSPLYQITGAEYNLYQVVPSPNYYTLLDTATLQLVQPFIAPTTGTYQISVLLVSGSGTPTIQPNSSGSFIQVLQLA